MRSDGEHTWIDAPADPATHHPTTLAPDPACPPEHEHDFYLWDLCGYLILRNTMSSEWVERVNAAYEWARDNDRLKDGIYRLPSPYGDPFREM